MSHFKTLFLTVFLLAAQICYAGSCDNAYQRAEMACKDTSPDFVKASQVMENGEDKQNIAALGRTETMKAAADYTKKLYVECKKEQRVCLLACQNELNNAESLSERDKAFDIADSCANGMIGKVADALEMAYNTSQLELARTRVQEVKAGRKESGGYIQGFTSPFASQ